MGIKGQKFTGMGISRVADAKRIRPFGMDGPPFDPVTGKYFPIAPPEGDGGVGATPKIYRMRVTAETGDYLQCVQYDGLNMEQERIYVAKPYMLRLSPFDGETRNGITYTYTDVNERTCAKDGETDITEVITPSYQGNDEVYAIGPVTGGTGVELDDGTQVVLIEISGISGARMWAETD